MATRRTATTTTTTSLNSRICYEVSTLETLKYAKDNDGKGYFSFTIPTFALRKQEDGMRVTITSNAHCEFVVRNFNSTWVIREISQEKETWKILSTKNWKKLPDNIKFYDKENNLIEPKVLDDLEDIEI